MQTTISHVLSRESDQAVFSEIIICLQFSLPLLSVHFQEKSAPTICLGCSLEGFTAFHQQRFHCCFVTVALSRILKHSCCLSSFFCRHLFQRNRAAAYDFAAHEHYKHLSLCEHGLSSHCFNNARLSVVCT